MLKSSDKGKKISRPIVWLAIAGISLGIAVMLLSISIATGFQQEIRDKVIGFGSHIQITEDFSNYSFESAPMLSNQPFIEGILEEPSVNNVQNVAYKPAIIQSREETGNEGENIRDIQGVVFKGIDNGFNETFFQQNLLEGQFPNYTPNKTNDSILISKYMSQQLQLDLGEKVKVFFIKEDGPKQRNLIISGIYETGLEDFDKQFALCDISHIRKINNWGISLQLWVRDEMEYGFPVLEAIAIGGNQNYRYSWNGGAFTESSKTVICPDKDTTIMVVATDFQSESYLSEIEPVSIPDTAWITISVDSSYNCLTSTGNAPLEMNQINDSTIHYSFQNISFSTTTTTSGGSAKYYTGGLEVQLNSYKDLFNALDIIQQHVSMEFNVSSIIERNEDIFNWLNMLDMNVYIIISLMILVAIINMSAALLVLILERTQMIGILKALGGNNWSIRKIFLYNGGYLITKGIIYGNIIAIGVILLQNQFEIITLPQANYYVNVVPMSFPIISIILINLGAFATCYLALVLPSYMITRISPVKAIRFE